MMPGRVGAPMRRAVAVIVTGIGLGSFVVAAVLVIVGTSVEIPSAATATLQLVGGLVVAAGLAWAVAWRSRVNSQPINAQRYMAGTLLAAAVAEAGFFLSVIAYWFSGNLVVLVAVAIIWLIVLLLLLATTRSADLGEV